MSKKSKGLEYRDAGVDIDAATEALKRIKPLVRGTFDTNVLCDIGTFGAMYRFDPKEFEDPVLVSSVDSVGTKLKLAFLTGKHSTVGIDIVSHCVNDILVQGARPLFFLDYIGTHKVEPEVIAEIIQGLAAGCRAAGCALIGGEIAELSDMYHPGEYDLVGAIVGVVDRARLVDGSTVGSGDVLIGLASSGLHTNGYSLARKVCFDLAGLSCEDRLPGVGRNVGDALLEPHRCYAQTIDFLSRLVTIRGMAHITGGGITDNLPRTLPEGLAAEVELNAWEVLPIFRFLQEQGGVSQAEMLRTFNMGIGYIVVVAAQEAERALRGLAQAGERAWQIGRVIPGAHTVHYTGELRYGAPD